MSFQVLESMDNAGTTLHRPTAAQETTIWGDYFLSQVTPSMGDDSSICKQIEGLGEEVRGMLKECVASRDTLRTLRLIDAIQRLGVAYHFDAEINEAALEDISHDNKDLYAVALWFRLLRQQGKRLSCDVFEKFKDSEGNFDASIKDDVAGMLSLYEASHLGIRGEDILDEALEFTTKNLKAILPHHLGSPLAGQVSHSLKWPLRFSVNRVEARFYMDLYAQDESHNGPLLKFAKLDFNRVQQLHQKELKAMAEWWESLDVRTNFHYVRDRLVEGYFWILQVYFEPQYSVGRTILTKLIQLICLLDDTFDNFGTLEELQILTEAIDRWDIEAIDVLPEYMKKLYRILLDVCSEIEDVAENEGKLYCMYYVKQIMKINVQAYLVEAEWREKGYVPNMEEYMNVAVPSIGAAPLALSSYIGMGEIATEEAFKWALDGPKIIESMSTFGRLMDDIVSHKFEQERDHVTSAVECYMEEYKVSEEQAVKELKLKARNAWKDINEECLVPYVVSMPLLDRVVNLAKAADTMYKDGDGYTRGNHVMNLVALLLKDPVPI